MCIANCIKLRAVPNVEAGTVFHRPQRNLDHTRSAPADQTSSPSLPSLTDGRVLAARFPVAAAAAAAAAAAEPAHAQRLRVAVRGDDDPGGSKVDERYRRSQVSHAFLLKKEADVEAQHLASPSRSTLRVQAAINASLAANVVRTRRSTSALHCTAFYLYAPTID